MKEITKTILEDYPLNKITKFLFNKTLEKEDVQKYEEFLYSVIVLADSYGKNPNWDGLNWTITPGKKLQEIINELKNENSQQEYYLVDLPEMAFKEGKKIVTHKIPMIEALGANTKAQLELIEKLFEQ
jgi:hypothetical protein